METEEQKAKIMVVDDSRLNLRILEEILSQDYNLIMLASGEGVLDTAIKEEPDLILLDIIMPGIDGYEVFAQLKTNLETSKIPVIFVTSLNDEQEEIKGLELGAMDYITKPFNPLAVQARIKNHIKLKKYTDLLERMSSLDGLTGIGNRRLLEEYLTKEVLRAKRNNTKLSVIMIDIDYFKKFNDAYGHVSGDECLRAVARTLSKNLNRSSDIVCRYGGEEFCAVLPETDLEGATKIAEKLRASIENLSITHKGSTAAGVVTISLGVAESSGLEIFTQDTILMKADENLYKAKESGRNMVCAE